MVHSRIAPTPSGYLHMGNAVNFVLTWLLVRKNNGVLRLRIDDLDVQRAKQQYIDDIFHTLDWLGIDWDEGPQSPEDHAKQYSQLFRQSRYDELIKQLSATGNVFACTCGRKNLEHRGNKQQYVCNCRAKNFPLNRPDAALRIVTPTDSIFTIPDIRGGKTEVILHDQMPDFVIKRRDGIAAYQVASLADDIEYKVNLIIRGTDLLPSTSAQLFLASLIGPSIFTKAKFYHHPLLTNENGEKLSKSAGGKTAGYWCDYNSRSEKFYHWLSTVMGWPEQAESINEMLNFANQGLDVSFPVPMKIKRI